MKVQTALYLIPVNISDAPLSDVLPEGNLQIIRELRYFIVENIRTARRFLKRCSRDFDINGSTFFELNGHTNPLDVVSFLEPLRKGEPMGVMSEAGCPAVADPGALAVSIARKEGLKVVPLVGPSSILLALMASGFNGQGFSFNGYLPIEMSQKVRKLKDLEVVSKKNDMTQIFIETPYRNNKMMVSLLNTLHPDTKLCVACEVTDPEKEIIESKRIADWRRSSYDFDKRPAIFLIYAH